MSRQNSLFDLANLHDADKGRNGYTSVYYDIMNSRRDSEVSLLEIGVFRGASMKMWYDFFSKGKIFGLDNGRLLPNSNLSLGESNSKPSQDDEILLNESVCVNVDFKWLENDRIKCAIADQRSKEQLENAMKHFEESKFDYIIDDGHHFQEHQQKTLGLLFSHVKPGGYYVIEDICCHEDLLNGSYWGQKEKDCTDSTDYVFSSYLRTNVLKSPYMTQQEIDFVVNNVQEIRLFDANGKNSSPVTCTSKLLVIKKKQEN